MRVVSRVKAVAASRCGVPMRRTIDNQADLVPQVIAERQRRALYLADERAPEFSTRHCNFYLPQGGADGERAR